MTDERLAPGTVVAARFRVESEAGAGGMGVVYRATDLARGGLVALKVLSMVQAADASRFSRERALLAELGHPGIVRYVDHGTTEAGRPFLAMEWLEGETLAARLRRAPLGVREALSVARGAALALGAAHAKGILHRDVKPANLFLVNGDLAHPKVLDFGIARRTRDDLAVTTTGTALGTPYYMAPEQARGQRELDARVDVYALGCVLFEMLTGARPFEHESLVAVLAAVLLEEPPSPREHTARVPEPLDRLVLSMIAKRRDARPADGLAVVAALDALALDDASLDPGPVRAPAALGRNEQRVICVVLVEGHHAPLETARTLVTGDDGDLTGRVQAAVEPLSGSVVALADGSLVATVGEAGNATDQAARAARCALAIRAVAPRAAVAIAAGHARVLGRAPVGEVVQRGADLLHGARVEPGVGRAAIRIDEVVAGLLDARFVVTQVDDVRTLDALEREPDTARTLRGRASPLMGRDRDLATLGAIFTEAASEPIARVALVVGAAGIGKTRVLGELGARLAADGARVLAVHVDPLAATAPYAALGQLVRSAAGIEDGDTLEVRRGKVLALARATAPEQAGRTAAMLGELCRAPFPDDADEALAGARRDPVLRGDLERRAFSDWLRGECAAGPVALLVDDAQHADRASLAMLENVASALVGAPLLLVLFARPDVDEQHPRLFAAHEPARLALSRLLPKAARTLVESVLGSAASPQSVARVLERGEGNPLYLEELARAARSGETSPPTSVLAMVEARLGVLDPEPRRVARAASVFGQRAPVPGVRALVGGREIDEALHALAERDVLAPEAGGAAVAFVQPLVREAAYAMLTDEDRALGHRLAGEWLAAHAEVEPIVLAQHFERGGAAGEAAVAYREAAERALSGDDLAGAAAHATRGLALAASSEARADLLATLALAHRWRAEYAEAFERAGAALALAAEGSRAWFDAASTLVSAAARVGRTPEIAALCARLEALDAAPTQRPAQIVALCRAAAAALAAHDRVSFARRLLRADVLAERLARPDPLAQAWTRTLHASAAYEDDDLAAFVAGTEAAVQAYEAAGDTRDACNQRVRLAHGLTMLGEPARAESALRLALADAERMGLRLVASYALQNLGHAIALLGRHDEAQRTLERAVAAGTALGDTGLVVGARIYLADVAREAGQLTLAEREATLALEDAGPFAAIARATLARVLARRGDAAAAEAEARAAVASHAGASEGDALVALALAEALDARGDREAARRVACEALDRVRARAAKVADLVAREGLLTRVPEHARLADLAR